MPDHDEGMTSRQAALIVDFGYPILCVQSRGCITAQEVRQGLVILRRRLIELHPQSTGCLWCDLQCMVRSLHFRFLHLPRLPQSSEPVVVRLAHGYLRTSAEFLASV